jgi:hypothetical protein
MECIRAESDVDDFEALARSYWRPIYRFVLASIRNADAAGTLARAELEKANARMLLGIRRLLTPEQWNKIKAEAPQRQPQVSIPGRQAAVSSKITVEQFVNGQFSMVNCHLSTANRLACK